MPKESIYELISNSLKSDGTLEDTFEFPSENNINKMNLTLGAMDGIILYHDAKGHSSITDLIKAIQQIGQEQKAKELTEQYFKTNYTLCIIDDIQQWIISNQKLITPSHLLNFADLLISESTSIEAIKFGLCLLELFDIEHNKEIRKKILTLASCEEFTIFCVYIISNWSDGNEIIFHLAKKLKGWGKIHSVERLEPVTKEIKYWMICHGCENAVLTQYLAPTCAKKIDILNILNQESLPQEEFDGISVILVTLCQDFGPFANRFLSLENKEQIIACYINQAKHIVSNLNQLSNIILIEEYLDEMKEKSESIIDSIKKFQELFSSPLWETKILSSISKGDSEKAATALQIAKKLEINLNEKVFELIKQKPFENYTLVWYLFEYGESYAKKVVNLYESILPLKEMAKGIDDLVGIGKEYELYSCLNYVLQFLKDYPLLGETLVYYALNCPVISCRSLSISTVQEWSKLLKQPVSKFSKRIYERIQSNASIEINEGLKTSYSSFI